jgi:hypothetical protein
MKLFPGNTETGNTETGNTETGNTEIQANYFLRKQINKTSPRFGSIF